MADINNKPQFHSQTWIKMKDQTVREFHMSVENNVQQLKEQGYEVEVRWLDSNSDVCDIRSATATRCRIVSKKINNFSNDDAARGIWIEEQLDAINEMNENKGLKR